MRLLGARRGCSEGQGGDPGFWFASFVDARGIIVFSGLISNVVCRLGSMSYRYRCCVERIAMMDLINLADWQTNSFNPI